MKSLLKLAVTNVHFKYNGIWYVQSDGLAMGASLAVILADVWMKSFESSLQKPELSEIFSRSDQNGKCKDCNGRVTYRGKGVEYGDLAFFDTNVNVSSENNITCHWYQKPTDTEIILHFRSCAPLQLKKNVIQGAVHRVFNATSNWLAFDQALEKNKTCWTKNQYPISETVLT